MMPHLVFRIGEILEFHTPMYMIFACIGLFALMMFIYNRLELLELKFEQFLVMIAFIVAGVAGGSKLLCILTRLPDVFADFSWKALFTMIWVAGFVFYGGLLGAFLGLYLYCRFFKRDYKYFVQVIIPAFPLFHTFGRLGCFFAGCCYGKPASWGVAMSETPDILRIPIQLIESGSVFIIFITLYILQKKHVKISLAHLYLFLYSILRFILEFFRGDEVRGVWLGISTSQWVSMFIFTYVVVYTIMKHLVRHSFKS